MKLNKRQKAFLATLLCVIAVGSVLAFPVRKARMKPCFYPQRRSAPTLILDAGHGGEDGGAVSVTGTPESGINLAIVQRMQQLCGFFGVQVILTRDGDYSLKDSNAETLAQMKRTDLQNRVSLIEETPNSVLISVHQNFFTASKNTGAQVFYAPTDGSDAWGVACQQLLCAALEPENTRQSKQISKEIYLMNHITCPAILVECGFLSNQGEAELLETPVFQTKLALVILNSYLTYDFA